MNTSSVIVIPVYKEKLSRNEEDSLQQCLKVFKNRNIVFCAPDGLSLEQYPINNQENIKVVYFEPNYFSNVSGYNALMLSKKFYERLLSFDFILIYQLDAWVFSDDLDYWCEKNYSYIGAPWFENFALGQADEKLWAVGNGGFSLRRTRDFLKVLNSDKKVFSFDFLWTKYRRYSTVSKCLRLPKLCIQFMFRNNVKFLFELFGENEDHFWSFHAKDIDGSFNVAPIKEALSFAFECNPRKMYKLNDNKVPFGVHAWEKYDFEFVKTVLFNN